MTSDGNVCVACGVVLRPTTSRCPLCRTEVVAGATRSGEEPLDVARSLIDPRRQRTTLLLGEACVVAEIAAVVLSLGTSSAWGVLAAAAYAGLSLATAPKALTRTSRRRESTRDQAIRRDDIATGPARSTTGGRAFQIEVEEVLPGYLFTGFGLFFGLVFPIAALVTSDSTQGGVAVGLAMVGALLATSYRSRREVDSTGFPSRGVPID